MIASRPFDHPDITGMQRPARQLFGFRTTASGLPTNGLPANTSTHRNGASQLGGQIWLGFGQDARRQDLRGWALPSTIGSGSEARK
jgi:hypothetical protein